METMLDAHADIWGMGEDSIFNGQLNAFRNELVKALSDPAGTAAVHNLVLRHAEAVDEKMLEIAMKDLQQNFGSELGKSKKRRKTGKGGGSASNKTRIADGAANPIKLKHVVDKMLFNYRNIGIKNSHLLLVALFILSCMASVTSSVCY